MLRVRSKREEGGFRRIETSLYWRETIGFDEVRGERKPFAILLYDVSDPFLGSSRI